MTTTTRKTTKTPAKAHVRTETLEQFNRELIEYGGYDPQFDVMVRDLFRVRAQKAQLTEARKAIFEHVKTAHAIGHRVIPGTPYELKMTNPKPGELYKAVSSAQVKKVAPAAWKRAQAPAPFVQVKAPAAVAAAVPELDAPEAGEFMDPATAAVTYKEHPAWSALKELRDEEADLLTRLDKVAAEFGWDGGAEDGPLVFADAWSIQLKHTQFSAEKLAELEPEVFESCAVLKQRAATPHVYVGKVGHHGEDWDADWAE